MRVGKRLNVVEAKKTRSCVVRLEKVRNPAIAKKPKPADTPSTVVKINRSLLKKRVVAEKVTPNTMPRVKKIVNRRTPVETELPPTIAAGRSRRAIKPNPKYAGEDMVTPKPVKTAGAQTSSSAKKLGSDKPRMRSVSSSEDFYNRESSEESSAEERQEKVDKKSDADFSTPLLIKKRGRPARSTPASRATPSQMQQLRKSLGKRKIENTITESMITRKRYTFAGPISMRGRKETAERANESYSQFLRKRNIPIQTQKPTQKDDTIELEDDDDDDNEAPKQVAEKLKRTELPKASPKLQNVTSALNKGLAERISALSKRNASPVTKSPKETVAKDEPKVETLPTIEDFESMPTFTIVNINDIMNKKGDVLLSQTNSSPIPASKPKKIENPKLPARSPSSSPPVKRGPKPRGRKPNPNKAAAAERVQDEQSPPVQKRSPPITKKPTILNHTLFKKTKGQSAAMRASSATATKTSPSDKPAPRILNSVVGKRTLPVKPMIANLDDSADEDGILLNLEDDDTEKEVDSPRNVAKQRNVALTTKSPAGTKENSLAESAANTTRKVPAEKVVIQRQGDKIIRKATCFETWYVINFKEEHPPKVVRNVLDMPIVELANVSKDIQLPSTSWSSKVSLYELSAVTLAKSRNLMPYTGDLLEHNIAEEDRAKYQPSCVMFRRAVDDRLKSRLPYDRAVIFKNKTFFTNIDGKNVKLVAAPPAVGTPEEVEILLQIVDNMTLDDPFVELATTAQ